MNQITLSVEDGAVINFLIRRKLEEIDRWLRGTASTEKEPAHEYGSQLRDVLSRLEKQLPSYMQIKSF